MTEVSEQEAAIRQEFQNQYIVAYREINGNLTNSLAEAMAQNNVYTQQIQYAGKQIQELQQKNQSMVAAVKDLQGQIIDLKNETQPVPIETGDTEPDGTANE